MEDLLYREVTQSIKAVFDLTARVDERVKMIVDKQTVMERRMEHFTDLQNELTTKVHVLQSLNTDSLKADVNIIEESLDDIKLRLAIVERLGNNTEHKWKLAFDFVYKTVWVVLVCYLLYKLNLQSPPLP